MGLEELEQTKETEESRVPDNCEANGETRKSACAYPTWKKSSYKACQYCMRCTMYMYRQGINKEEVNISFFGMYRK